MTVTAERHRRVLVIRMQREAKRNAIDAETTAGLDAALNLLEDDAELWAGVLTGTSTVFSAAPTCATGPANPRPRRRVRAHAAPPLDTADRGGGGRRVRRRLRAGVGV
jgi:hypothetical protein